jgi:hypothetical protein
MTEAEWLQCSDPRVMLDLVRFRKSRRKLELFSVACCRHLVSFADFSFDSEVAIDNRFGEAVDVAEKFADGLATREEKQLIEDAVRHDDALPGQIAMPRTVKWEIEATLGGGWDFWVTRFTSMLPIASPHSEKWSDLKAKSRRQCDWLRDIFGNPFRPVALDPAWLRWNDGLIRHAAQRIYDERAFTDLPILGDALEDSGCRDADILEHCRRPGEHVRGCWVVDLLLGKE